MTNQAEKIDNRVDHEVFNKQFVVRRSNRLSHSSRGGPPLPCGFFVKIIDFDKLNCHTSDSKLNVVGEMSSLAGSYEARARNKLVDERGEHLETKKHAKYTHEYFKINVGDIVLLEWFRCDENSARAYLEDGFNAFLQHCRKLEEVLENSFPKPAEIYDHIPRGKGILAAYHQVYRILSKEMLEEGMNLKTAHVIARLENGLTIEPSRKIADALGIMPRSKEKIDLYRLYRKRTSLLLESLREVIPLVEERIAE